MATITRKRRAEMAVNPTSRPTPGDKLGALMREPYVWAELQRRLWEKVDKRGPTDCWPWTAGCKRGGYGSLRAPDRGDLIASRVAWAIAHRKSPGPWFIRHTCDNPPCCNPAHLLKGTSRDNSRDMVKRGRGKPGSQRGEANARAKLSASDVGVIRGRLEAGEMGRALAAEYGVTPSAISCIKHGRSWAA